MVGEDGIVNDPDVVVCLVEFGLDRLGGIVQLLSSSVIGKA